MLTALIGVLLQTNGAPVGIWRSIGYGLVWDVRAQGITTFEVTGTTCVPSTRYRLATGQSAAGELVFRADTNIGAVANDWVIRSRAGGGRLRAHTPGTLADVEFRLLPALPAPCTQPLPPTREATFEVFSRTMAEHYAFFRERGMMWEETVARARGRLAAAANDRDFYDLLSAMVAPLQDRHTDVTATTLGIRNRHGRPIPNPLTRDDVQRLTPAPERYLIGAADRFHDGRVQIGRLAESIGYLRLTALYAFATTGRFEDDSIAFEQVLAAALPRLAGVTGMVLDLRINGGGYDALARLFASHFTDRGYPAVVKRARAHPTDETRLTPAWTARVEPAAVARYTGPLLVLIGPNTLSAGEVLAMMLMGRRPRVTTLGEPTQGIFADELVRRLPNGWQFQLSNERYALPDGRVFEGRGVPVDVAVPIYPPGEREPGARDRAIEAAIEILSRR